MLAPDSEMDDLLMQPPTLTILPACIDCCYDETLLKLDKKNTIKIKFLLPLFPDLESLVYRKPYRCLSERLESSRIAQKFFVFHLPNLFFVSKSKVTRTHSSSSTQFEEFLFFINSRFYQESRKNMDGSTFGIGSREPRKISYFLINAVGTSGNKELTAHRPENDEIMPRLCMRGYLRRVSMIIIKFRRQPGDDKRNITLNREPFARYGFISVESAGASIPAIGFPAMIYARIFE